MVTIILITLAFAVGFVSGVVNANSKKVAKAKSIIDEIKK